MSREKKTRYKFTKQELKLTFLSGRTEWVSLRNSDNSQAPKKGGIIVGIFPDHSELELEIKTAPVFRDGVFQVDIALAKA